MLFGIMKTRKETLSMNINKLKTQLLEMGQKIGLQLHEEDANSITLHAQITAEEYFKDSIYLRLVVFSSGTIHMFLTFNKVTRTYEQLYRINEFNSESAWFKGYIANINGKDFFELHYSAVALQNEQEVIDTFGFLLNDLLNEKTLQYLRPILKDEQ